MAATVAGLTLTASSVLAQVAPDTKDKLKCETGTNNILGKFVGSKAKCVAKCIATARKTSGPYAGCQPPAFLDPATQTCINGQKGVTPKAAAAITKACTAACPQCYNSTGNCPSGGALEIMTEGLVDTFGSLIYCSELGASPTTPPSAQAKCEDTVAKNLTKFVASKGKCFQKCVTNEFKTKIPAGSCTAGSPSDMATATCVSKAAGKAAATIDKTCSGKTANPPCYVGFMASGQGWTSQVEGAVDGQLPAQFCGP